MNVKFNDLNAQWLDIKEHAQPRIDGLFEQCSFILGPDVAEFENNFARYIGSRYAIGVSNGTDALKLSFECLNLAQNSGIIIQGNTYVATALAARYACPNAEIILCEVDDNFQTDTNKLKSILEDRRTDWVDCVICPVHMYGSANNMTHKNRIGRNYRTTELTAMQNRAPVSHCTSP